MEGRYGVESARWRGDRVAGVEGQAGSVEERRWKNRRRGSEEIK